MINYSSRYLVFCQQQFYFRHQNTKKASNGIIVQNTANMIQITVVEGLSTQRLLFNQYEPSIKKEESFKAFGVHRVDLHVMILKL